MAKYSYETYVGLKEEASKSGAKSNVGYFKLNENEEALIRLNYSSVKEISVVSTHNVKIKNGDKSFYRQVSCLRVDAREPLDNCPLCQNGEKLSSRIFLMLLHYVRDEKGQIVAKPEVANLPSKYINKIAKYYNEYGDLRNVIFKITKTGNKLTTEYDFTFANPMIYKEELGYVKDFKGFEGFDACPHSYVEKSFEDITAFLSTGEFPFKKTTKEGVIEEALNVQEPANDSKNIQFDTPYVPTHGQQATPQVANVAVTPNVKTETTNQPKVSEQRGTTGTAFARDVTNTTTDVTQRPRRTYDLKS